MTNLKKITASVLALMMIISLAACGGNTIVGRWNYELEVKDIVENSVKNSVNETDSTQQAMYDELFKAFDGCTIILSLELNADGTYHFAPDKESAEEAMKQVKENLKTVLPKAYMAMGLTEEQFKQYLVSKKQTLDQMVESVAGRFDIGSLTGSESYGQYVFEDGKLYMYTGKEKDDSAYLETKLSGNELEVTKVEGEISGFKGVENLLPMTFKKA